jgi:hypothetical protein
MHGNGLSHILTIPLYFSNNTKSGKILKFKTSQVAVKLRSITMLVGHWKMTPLTIQVWGRVLKINIPNTNIVDTDQRPNWSSFPLNFFDTPPIPSLYLVMYTYVSCRWVIFKPLTMNLLPPEGLTLKSLGSNCVENVQYLHSSQGPWNEAVISLNIGQ